MPEIIIMGGGIAGMTVCHELLGVPEMKNYKITLIERNPGIGGLARTYQDREKKICPYEYSWRAYGQWYQNLYHVMKQIPFDEKTTVFDNLVVLNGGRQTCRNQIPDFTTIPVFI